MLKKFGRKVRSVKLSTSKNTRMFSGNPTFIKKK
jgi:hypothetical protein